MWCVCVYSPANLLLKLPCSNRADGLDRYKSCAPTMRGTTPETLTGTWCSKALPPELNKT